MDQGQAHSVGADGMPHPPWYTPQRLLALFCWVTFLVYLDQGVISSNGVNRQIQVITVRNQCCKPGMTPFLPSWCCIGRPCDECTEVCKPSITLFITGGSQGSRKFGRIMITVIILLQAEFEVGDVGDGTLPSAFLAGLLIASIVYSELTTRFNAFRMIGAHPQVHRCHLCAVPLRRCMYCARPHSNLALSL